MAAIESNLVMASSSSAGYPGSTLSSSTLTSGRGSPQRQQSNTGSVSSGGGSGGGNSGGGGGGSGASGSAGTAGVGSSGPAPTYASFAPPPSSLPQHTSPLLSSTPPTVTKALSQAYPLILSIDYILGLATWTGDDVWKSFLVVAAWSAGVLYFETIVRYLGHLVTVGLIAGYVWFNKEVEKHQAEHPTLDSIVHTLNNVVTRLDLFLLPITSLNLSSHDVTRLVFTTLFMTPLYIILTFFIVTPRTLLFVGGVFVLTYHSVWARVTRAILWRSRAVRLLSFYMTGLDFSGSPKSYGSEAQLAARGAVGISSSSSSTSLKNGGRPVRFTYVLYENQRRWLGIGWTANLLAYERAAWSDEFLNESSPPSKFKLPDADGTGMLWRWVDKTWRLDLTNDGALVINGTKTSKVDPGPNEGFIFYDTMWKKPSAEDSYSKYTRRRRWIRTAELISHGQTHEVDDDLTTADAPSSSSSADQSLSSDNSDIKKRKSIRFEE